MFKEPAKKHIGCINKPKSNSYEMSCDMPLKAPRTL
jgi:hypothetical protein